MTFENMYDVLKEYVVVDNSEALDLAFAIGGCNEETARRILFYFTGWDNFEGFIEDENLVDALCWE